LAFPATPQKMKDNENSAGVVIADSQFLVTESLKHLLTEVQGLKLIEIVAEKSELLRLLGSGNISLLITDPSTTDLSDFQELRELKDDYPFLHVLLITNGLNKSELHELNNLGFNNIVHKTEGRQEILEAITATLKGKKYYSEELLDLLLEPEEKKRHTGEPAVLTASEIEIVKLISEGLTTKEIATRKNVSFHTVITHRKNIFRKLGVTSVSELIMYAIRTGIIHSLEYYI
jgi:DNA-binding NarL/FixJ family response regulator